jgi:hypothetical protein
MRMIVLLVLSVSLYACAQKPLTAPGRQADHQAVSQISPADIQWKAILIAGDDSIPNFDRAVDSVDHLLAAKGVKRRIILSAAEDQWRQGKRKATPAEIEQAFQDLDLRPGEGCLLFMTSHGNPSGFYLARHEDARHTWTHRQYADLFNKYCGSLPSVAIISACYSGGFIDESILRPNLIMLTAARRDRPSFGCSTETEYTYYDDCLLSNWPTSQTFEGLAGATRICVEGKERVINAKPSYPQLFVGSQIQGLHLP